MNALLLLAVSLTWSLVAGGGYHELVGIPAAKAILDEETRVQEEQPKIVGGAASSSLSHPYMAGLVITLEVGSLSACGASLLTSRRLVTAAHCWADGVQQAAWFEVVLGSQHLFYGGTRVQTSHVVLHPEFNPVVSAIRNDVAMVYLPHSVAFDANVHPVALPSTLQLGDSFTGEWATAVGYGKTSDLEAGISLTASLREVSLLVVPVSSCGVLGGGAVTDQNVCTSGLGGLGGVSGGGGVGICGGDSGGPLTVVRNGQRVLIGVSSFVARGMCHLGYPSAFARVTSFYGFIVSHLF